MLPRLDHDVNLHTTDHSGQRRIRETDGRYARTQFGTLKDISRESQAKDQWLKDQLEKYGDVLFV